MPIEFLVSIIAVAFTACVIILVKSIFTLMQIEKGLHLMMNETQDNTLRIKWIQVELDNLEEINRRQVHGKMGNEAQNVRPGGPDIQRSSGHPLTRSPECPQNCPGYHSIRFD